MRRDFLNHHRLWFLVGLCLGIDWLSLPAIATEPISKPDPIPCLSTVLLDVHQEDTCRDHEIQFSDTALEIGLDEPLLNPSSPDAPTPESQAQTADTVTDSVPTDPLEDPLTPSFPESIEPPEELAPEGENPTEPSPGAENSTPEGEAGEETDGDMGSSDSGGDPDLGTLRLKERELSLQRPPIRIPVYFSLDSSYLSTSNTLASENFLDDRLFRTTTALTVSPILNRKTFLFGSVQGSVYRYGELSRLDYNELRLQVGARRVLFPRVVGELSWSNRQLYFRENGDRFLNEQALSLGISRRDPLMEKVYVDSFYRLRAGFAEPQTSSRVVQILGSTLNYDVTRQINLSITGLGVWTQYTQRDRQDLYGQVLGRLTYKLADNTKLGLFAAWAQGESSSQGVDFDNTLLGISFDTNIKLF